MRVLVAEDQPSYREELAAALGRRGHEVRTAASGREAIRDGARQRPDVLVADWLLESPYHGLHVAEALSWIVPTLRTVLITGYGSTDIAHDALELGVIDLLEKPFGIDRLVGAVAAAGRRPAPAESPPVGVARFETTGWILDANPAADALLATVAPGRRHVDQLLPAGVELEAASREWLEVPRDGEGDDGWWLRTRRLGDSGEHLLVLVERERPEALARWPSHYGRELLIRLLLDQELPAGTGCPLRGRALVLDESNLLRRRAVAELERMACLCHSTPDAGRALALLRRDPGVEVVVVDLDLEAADPARFVRSVIAERPGVRVVGQSVRDRRAELGSFGLERFLRKPWTGRELTAELAASGV